MPKIHQLPPLTDDPEIADVFPMDDDSVADPSSPDKTKKITLEQMRDFIIGQFAVGNNLLLNGNFDIWQRNTTFTQNDDLYIADRWNALQEANSSWTFARDTDVPTSGAKYSLKCSNATANNQAAIVQILEAADAQQLLNQNVSLSFYAKTTGLEISNLRCAILSWSSTADVVTSDVISTWAQNGTDPTWATNWTMENTPANLALTNSWQRFTIENIAIDTASMKNIAVVIWVDDGTITSGDDFWISEVMLNVGGTAADFTPRTIAEELALCQRYFEKSYPLAQFAGQTYADVYYNSAGTRDNGGGNAFIEAKGFFKARKRVAPTMAWYNPVTGAGTTHWRAGGVTGTNYTSMTVNLGFETYCYFASTTNSGDFHIGSCWTADAEL